MQDMPVTSTATEAASQARTAVAEAAEQAREKTEALWDQALEFIEENPGKSIGMAFVAGLAIGAIVAGGSSETEKPLASADSAAAKGSAKWDSTKDSLAESLEELRGLLASAVTNLRA